MLPALKTFLLCTLYCISIAVHCILQSLLNFSAYVLCTPVTCQVCIQSLCYAAVSYSAVLRIQHFSRALQVSCSGAHKAGGAGAARACRGGLRPVSCKVNLPTIFAVTTRKIRLYQCWQNHGLMYDQPQPLLESFWLKANEGRAQSKEKHVKERHGPAGQQG